MTPFAYTRAASATEAARAAQPGAHYLAGGTSLLDLMKLGVERPEALIDLNRAADLGGVAWSAGGALRIGAAARMSALARDGRVARRFPVLHQGLLAGATPQLRNMASFGGNLLQRTRCIYFRGVAFPACNKRVPGSGCAALGGVNDNHALLGWTEACVATHPSDLAVALLALDARVVTDRRSLPLEALHRLPGDDPQADTVLAPGELILAVEVPAGPDGARSAYGKAPPAGGFAIVSAGVVLHVVERRIAFARVALGGVAHKPWRSAEAEAALLGREPGESAFRDAADAALAGARPLSGNAYKVPLARTILREALARAAAGHGA